MIQCVNFLKRAMRLPALALLLWGFIPPLISVEWVINADELAQKQVHLSDWEGLVGEVGLPCEEVEDIDALTLEGFREEQDCPPWMGKLWKLESLSFKGASFKGFSEIMGYLPLKFLRFLGGLGTVPYHKVRLQWLKVLDLSRTLPSPSQDTKVTIPEWVWEARNLRELRLRGNKLTVLPPRVGQLTLLETLDVAQNRLVDLPNNLGLLGKLERFDLSHNELNVLPRTLLTLPPTTRVYFSDNPLSFFPKTWGVHAEGWEEYLLALNRGEQPPRTYRRPRPSLIYRTGPMLAETDRPGELGWLRSSVVNSFLYQHDSVTNLYSLSQQDAPNSSTKFLCGMVMRLSSSFNPLGYQDVQACTLNLATDFRTFLTTGERYTKHSLHPLQVNWRIPEEIENCDGDFEETIQGEECDNTPSCKEAPKGGGSKRPPSPMPEPTYWHPTVGDLMTMRYNPCKFWETVRRLSVVGPEGQVCVPRQVSWNLLVGNKFILENYRAMVDAPEEHNVRFQEVRLRLSLGTHCVAEVGPLYQRLYGKNVGRASTGVGLFYSSPTRFPKEESFDQESIFIYLYQEFQRMLTEQGFSWRGLVDYLNKLGETLPKES